MCSTWANGIILPSGDIPKLLNEAYLESQVLTKAVMG